MTLDRHNRCHGYGLGLSIVHAVAAAHHAAVITSARAEGGLTVTVRFMTGPDRGP